MLSNAAPSNAYFYSVTLGHLRAIIISSKERVVVWGAFAIRTMSRVTKGLLTLLTVGILFAFNFELVGVVAFRYLYSPHPALGKSVFLALHCALAGVLTWWMYRQFFHDHLWYGSNKGHR
ncbi:hypothetical protein C7445_103203 [Alicyclobacillus sacchari]|uniref:Uncharacterized protein n=1 Tax=Alicyclobacillus sacchari TaxID=392010 RepID=A0A4R8LTS9_9BACL|nr:hypothetical protein [Alicyclobacillus sacchari]TDY50157.1 hypothetical protein C7445_103203 [Alicyclobacillus sacchari]